MSCSQTFGLVVEATSDKSTEICADELSASRDSHVTVTDSSPVQLYVDNSRSDFLLVLTGIRSLHLGRPKTFTATSNR